MTAHLLHDAVAAGERPANVLATIVDAYGARRVIWGSDFPQTPVASYREAVTEGRSAAAALPEQDRDDILGGNALRLWWPVSQSVLG